MAQLETKLSLKAADRVAFYGSDHGYFWLSAYAGAGFGDDNVTVHFADVDQVRAIHAQMTKALAEHDALAAAKEAARAALAQAEAA